MPSTRAIGGRSAPGAGHHDSSARRLTCRAAAIIVLALHPSISHADGDGGDVIFAAATVETQTDRNLAEEWLRSLDAIDWHALPFRWALTTRRGSGRRQIAIFSDPNCPYCRRFEQDLAKVDNITIHIFMYPVIRPQSVTQSKSVWCSRDRVEAWNALVLSGVEPRVAPDCDNPVDELLSLGRKLKVSMTPTWFLPNGERYQGALSVRDILPLLDKASPRAPR